MRLTILMLDVWGNYDRLFKIRTILVIKEIGERETRHASLNLARYLVLRHLRCTINVLNNFSFLPQLSCFSKTHPYADHLTGHKTHAHQLLMPPPNSSYTFTNYLFTRTDG